MANSTGVMPADDSNTADAAASASSTDKETTKTPGDMVTVMVRVQKDQHPYKCGFCGPSFRMLEDLADHVREKHSAVKPYQCGFCKLGYRTCAELVTHTAYHQVFQCVASSSRAKNADLVLVPKSKVPVTENPKTSPVSVGTKNLSALRKAASETNLPQGAIVLSNDLNVKSMRYIVTDVSGSCAPFPAEKQNAESLGQAVCDALTGKQKSGARRQERSSTIRTAPSDIGGDEFLCRTCGERLLTGRDLKKHAWIEHRDDIPFHCPHCTSRFREKKQMQYHVDTQHATELTHLCSLCGDKFKSRVCLRLHIRRKHQILPSTVLDRLSQSKAFESSTKCPDCEEKFKFQRDLKRHCRVEHSNDKPFHCPQCPARFTMHVSLIYHVDSKHSDERPHVCPVCDLSFKVRHSLRNHVRKRHKINPWTVLCYGKPLVNGEKQDLSREAESEQLEEQKDTEAGSPNHCGLEMFVECVNGPGPEDNKASPAEVEPTSPASVSDKDMDVKPHDSADDLFTAYNAATPVADTTPELDRSVQDALPDVKKEPDGWNQ